MKKLQFEVSTVIRKDHTQPCLLAPKAKADAEPKTGPETEADPLFEPRVDEEEVLTESAGLEPRPVPSPDFAVEEAVGVAVLALTLAPFTCDGCSRLLLMMGLV